MVALLLPASRDPIGSFKLTTVDGSRAPVVWHTVELPEGGQLQLSWTTGRMEVERDGRFRLTLTSEIKGPGLPGSPRVDSAAGSWRRTRDSRVTLAFDDGRRSDWPAIDGFRSLTLRSAYADLDGERRPITLVFVRE